MAKTKDEAFARAGTDFRLSSLLARRSVAVRILILVAGVGVATGVRSFLGIMISGAPYAFYFPAIMLVTVLAGWETGAIATIVSIFLGLFLFMPPVLTLHWPAQAQWFNISIFAAAATFQVALAHWLRQAIEQLDESEARYHQLISVTSGIVWTTDALGHVDAPQTGWTEVTGIAWPAYRGLGWLDSVHEEDRAGIIPDAARLGPQGFHQAEFRLRDAQTRDWRWFGARAVPIRDRRGRVRTWIATMTDIHERKRARERRDIVIGELRHRLKNLFTVIGSLAQSSKPPNQPEVDAYLNKLMGRLHALNAAADLVMVDWRVAIEIREMVSATLAPFMAGDTARIDVDGPSLELGEETGGALALAIHELATNALKYGALSAPEGKVALRWSCVPGPRGEEFILTWKESGGPPPVKPNQEGFGTRVVQFAAAREKAGEVNLNYQPDGLLCRIAYLRTPAAPPANLAIETLEKS
jgi:PAS domain S-box-containing protein